MTREEILQLEGLGPMTARVQVANWLEELHAILADDPYRHIPCINVYDDYVEEPRAIRSFVTGPDVD